MSTTWTEDYTTEYDEYDDAELYDDSEAFDDAEASSAERRRRARRIALARRRAAQRRAAANRMLPATRPARPASTQQVVSAVRDLDLESKVAQDGFRSAAAAQNKRMSRAEYATVASVLANQFVQSFDAPDNKFARAALLAAPLALLAPQRHGKGLEAIVKDPRVIGGVGVAALVLIGQQRDKKASAERIEISGPETLISGESDVFVADVLDGRGKSVDTPVSWESSDPEIASIDPTTGAVTAKVKVGTVAIKATAGGISRRARLKVVPDPYAVAAPAEPAALLDDAGDGSDGATRRVAKKGNNKVPAKAGK